jgi:hypothetical protein
MLMNKCGNATCHGSASNNAFHLVNVGRARRQQRLETEQNLEAALGQIDRERPDLSPLLRKPQDGESLVHRGVFFGPTGNGQIKMLQEWVREAAAQLPEADIADLVEESSEIQLTSGEQSTEADPRPSTPAVSPLIIEIPRTPRPRTNPEQMDQRNDRPAVTNAAEDDAAFLRQILDEERPDPFDPDKFNRQVHGRAADTRP